MYVFYFFTIVNYIYVNNVLYVYNCIHEKAIKSSCILYFFIGLTAALCDGNEASSWGGLTEPTVQLWASATKLPPNANSHNYSLDFHWFCVCNANLHVACPVLLEGNLTLTLPGPYAGMGGSLDSYCSLKPLCSGMGEVVPARTSPTLLPPSPRTVLSLSCFKVSQCINCCDWHFKS